MDLSGKKVSVIGLGNSGINAAELLIAAGARVWATDSRDDPKIRASAEVLRRKGVKVETGRHTIEFVADSEIVVVSPGVEDASACVKWALGLGIPVISEMELGFIFCKGTIIAITGTNGKTTVTTLIGQILKDGARDVVVCGNIGNSLCGEISNIGRDTWVVLEVSSFQLERIEKFKPKIAVILNITDDHLDRHGSFRNYFDAKMKISKNQDESDLLILNHDAANLRIKADRTGPGVLYYSKYEKTSGAYTRGGHIICVSGKDEIDIGPVDIIKLKGLHNLENVLAASLAGIMAGIKSDSIARTISNFKGLAHRVETVDTINGIEYVDDSKGTTVDSTLRALESSGKPVILIAGGRDKSSDFSAVREAVKKNVSHLVVIGEAKDKIREALGDVVSIHEAYTMHEAVRIASCLAEAGHMVLLSPMCASFDMFKDYKHRGEAFKQEVGKIREEFEKAATKG